MKSLEILTLLLSLGALIALFFVLKKQGEGVPGSAKKKTKKRRIKSKKGKRTFFEELMINSGETGSSPNFDE